MKKTTAREDGAVGDIDSDIKHEPGGWGFTEIHGFQSRYRGGSIDSAYEGEHKRYQRALDAYFTTPIDIFPDIGAKTLFRSVRRPGYLEDYLKRNLNSKFPGFDDDVRGLIDDLGQTYISNLGWFVFLKRAAQFLSLLAFVIAVYLTYPSGHLLGSFDLLGPNDDKHPVYIYSLAIAAVVAGITFVTMNRAAFEKYSRALLVSCQTVSQAIQARMADLLGDFTKLDAKIARDEHERDWPDRSALWTQMEVWTAKRSEYIEVYLLYEMQHARRQHTFRHRWGLFFAVLIMLAFLALAAVLATRPHADLSFPAALALLTLVVSWISYSYNGWNSGEDIVRGKLDTSQWLTYPTLRMHERLGEQVSFDKKTIVELKNSHRGGTTSHGNDHVAAKGTAKPSKE
ncbi:MAG TPA: hypothetical protein VFV07_01140 [Rhizomicrobium sp.]|nr:hypothetical protein [Rhizomicrobium sp.]